MSARSFEVGFRPVRRDQLFTERVHDTYQLQAKLSEPTVCPVCGAVYHSGRWQWADKPAGAHAVLCPACHRIKDRFPAGFLDVSGDYFAAHRDELVRLMRHHEQREKAEHPLARIMDIVDSATGTMVTTTDIHLARNLGEALHHAYQGELEFHYNDAENLLRVHWKR
jgi:NMD protein affecting ribosome stability and mRNA decay